MMIPLISKLFRRESKKTKPQFPRRFVVIRWANPPSTNEDLEIFSAHKKIVEVFICPDFKRPLLIDVQDYLPGMEKLYEYDGFYVFDITSGTGTTGMLLDSAVSWDLYHIRR